MRLYLGKQDRWGLALNLNRQPSQGDFSLFSPLHAFLDMSVVTRKSEMALIPIF